MATTTKPITVERYREVTLPGDHKQLVEGEIIFDGPSFAHALLQGRVFAALVGWINSEPGFGTALFPTDIAIDEHNAFGPDVLWFADPDYRPPPGETYADRLSDLCVEVRSPSTWRYDIGAKKRKYEQSGLPELWLVDNKAEVVLAFRRSTPDAPGFDIALELERGEELWSPMLPGFALALDELFAD